MYVTLTLAVVHWIANETLWTLALEASHGIAADRIPATRRPATLIVIDTAGGSGISIETGRAIAAITALQVGADGPRTAHICVGALVDVHTPIVWIADKSVLAQARVVARRVYALRIDAARAGNIALVHVQAELFAVALIARIAFA